jgi:hypothetical protein
MNHEFSALSVNDKTSVFDIILNPKNTTAVAIRPEEKSETYLDKCARNLTAELWGLYSSKVRPEFRAWRDVLMDRVYFQSREVRDEDNVLRLVVGAFQDVTCSKAVDLKDLRWSWVVWRDQLHLLLPPGKKMGAGAGEDDTLMFRAGCRVNDRYNSGGDNFFHVVGYVQPYYAELSAVKEFQLKVKGGKRDEMISMLANPSTRGEFLFNSRTEFPEEMVPINELQHTIIGGLGKKIECIQGPPGTGKSTTIFHIVQSAIPAGYHAIVTCVQNKALDSIAEKLGPTGLPFVVYGNPTRLGDWAKRFTLAAQVEKHPEVVEIRNRLRKLEGKRALVRKSMKEIEANWFDKECKVGWKRMWMAWVVNGNHAGHLALQEDLACLDSEFHPLFTDLVDVRFRIKMELLENARASLSTMDGLAGADILPRPSVVIIDEAGTVPEYKMPLLLTMKAEAIVAIGDQNQLQPFSHTSNDGEALDGFFQRVVKALGKGGVPMLKEQYRMHPDICGLVSELFYAGELVTGERVKVARLNVVGGGLSWRNYPDVDAESDGKLKKCNAVEVDLIGAFMCDELPDLLSQGKSVAIITFYKQQYLELMKMGEAMGMVRTQEECKNAPPGAGRFKDPNFRIVTVDAAQGSEADVVVLSCVRCNRRRNLGFITDKNRLCVALSRARERLIVVGSKSTLQVDPVWREVMRRA